MQYILIILLSLIIKKNEKLQFSGNSPGRQVANEVSVPDVDVGGLRRGERREKGDSPNERGRGGSAIVEMDAAVQWGGQTFGQARVET